MYYDRAGNPITLEEWCELFGDTGYKIIRQTKLPDGGLVSTVWLGLDHAFRGPPQIFETMAFWPDREVRRCERYATLPAARSGHAAMVKEIRRADRKLRAAMAEADANKKPT